MVMFEDPLLVEKTVGFGTITRTFAAQSCSATSTNGIGPSRNRFGYKRVGIAASKQGRGQKGRKCFQHASGVITANHAECPNSVGNAGKYMGAR